MRRDCHRSAFTLIEVLIVVVIMAVLAATIIPQFSSSTTDAKMSSLKFNLHTLRSQVEMYKVHHGNTVPTLATFVNQMTKTTDAGGTVGTGTTFIYGPYFQGEVPQNPFKNSNALVTSEATSEAEAKAAVSGTAGWQYNPTTGMIYPNNAEYYQ